MDRVRIPNLATYLPVAPADLLLAAPLAARLLFRTTLPGRVLQGAAWTIYAGSAAVDWAARADARKIDFTSVYGIDPLAAPSATAAQREADVERLVERLNAEYRPYDMPRRELAVTVDRHLTDYIATITGQRVETSAQVREFMLAQFVFPFALGAADPITGDVAIFQKVGVFEPHVITHEFCHRKGYLKEAEAQILSYFALIGSGDDALIQSVLCERLDRQLYVLAERDATRFLELLEETGLREDLAAQFRARHPDTGGYAGLVTPVMRRVYDARMKLTGQNGLRDYDESFTDFLLAFEERALPAATA